MSHGYFHHLEGSVKTALNSIESTVSQTSSWQRHQSCGSGCKIGSPFLRCRGSAVGLLGKLTNLCFLLLHQNPWNPKWTEPPDGDPRCRTFPKKPKHVDLCCVCLTLLLEGITTDCSHCAVTHSMKNV